MAYILKEKDCWETIKRLQEVGWPQVSLNKATQELKIPYNTARKHLERLVIGVDGEGLPTKFDDFSIQTIPPKNLPIGELVEWRKKQFEQLDKHKQATKMVRVRVKLEGAVAIVPLGDPHCDDDGCNIGLIQTHADVIKKTKGMYAANIGDSTNNWVGNLARLYGQQATSAEQSWELFSKWFMREFEWLFFLDGNHGAWSGAGDPVKWILANSSTIHGGMSAKLALTFPNGRIVRINASHDFGGKSMWNSAYGPAKFLQLNGGAFDIAVCGHLHTSGYQIMKDPYSGKVMHALRVAGYKIHDRYAEELGLPDQHISAAAAIVINPESKTEEGLVHVMMDVEEGASYLTWLRKRGGY